MTSCGISTRPSRSLKHRSLLQFSPQRHRGRRERLEKGMKDQFWAAIERRARRFHRVTYLDLLFFFSSVPSAPLWLISELT